MAKKLQDGEVNRSAAIRELLKGKPDIKASEAVATLAEKGIVIRAGLFYLVKGNMVGHKKRRRKMHRKAVDVVTAGHTNTATVKSDALATIRKVKAVAAEVGGLRTLKGIVDALSE